jgi:DNA-binding transcriptional regulator YdaS (Cro superfamily)
MSTTPEAILEQLKKDHTVKGIADLLGDITPQAVSQWKRVPPAWCIPLEAATGVSRHELRPDIFGPSQGKAA